MSARAIALFVLWLGLTALVASALTPPFQSPDERHHVGRAYVLSQGQLFLETPPASNSGGPVDTGLLELMASVTYLDRKRDVPVDPAQAAAAQVIFFSGEQTFYAIPGTGYYLPLVYAPAALAFAVGEHAGVSPLVAYRMARALTGLVALAVLLLALLWLRPSTLVLGLLAVPLFAFQLGAATIDGLSTALALLYLAVIVRAWRVGRALSLPECALLMLLLVTVGGARPHVAPFAFLPLVWAAPEHRRRAAAVSIAGLALLVAWCAFGLATTVDLRVDRGASTGQIVVHYLASPVALLRVLFHTFRPEQLFSWLRSFIGLLGAGEFRAHNVAFVSAYFALPILAWASHRAALDPALRRARRLVWAMSAVSAFLVLMMLLATWTPHPAHHIQGVAGRYFWVPALFAAAMLGLERDAAPRAIIPSRRVALGRAVLPLWALASFVGLVVALINRYVR